MKKQAAIVLLALSILLSAGGGVSRASGGGSSSTEVPTCKAVDGVMKPQFINDDCWHRYNGHTYRAAVAASKLHTWFGQNVPDISSVKGIGATAVPSPVGSLNSIVAEALRLDDYVALTQSDPKIQAICDMRFPVPCDCSKFPADQTGCQASCTNQHDGCLTAFNSLNETKAIQTSSSVPPAAADPFQKMVYDVGQVLREVDAVKGDIATLAQAADPTATAQGDALKLFLSYKDLAFTLSSDARVGAVRSKMTDCAVKYPGACSPACDTVAASLSNGSTTTLTDTVSLAFCRAVQDPPGATPSKGLFDAAMNAKATANPCVFEGVPCDGMQSASWSVQLFNNTLRELAFSRGYYFDRVDACSSYVSSLISQEKMDSAWVQLDDIITFFACRILFPVQANDADAWAAGKAAEAGCVAEVQVCAQYCNDFINCPAVGNGWNKTATDSHDLPAEVQSFCSNQASLCACAP